MADMHFLAFIVILSILFLRAQTNAQGTCTIWGDPHLVGFPVDPQQASLRASYWCRWAGRMLILKNAFIEYYVNVTDSPYWNEYYEINLFYNETKLCTITPDSENCPRQLVTVNRPRNSLNSRQIYYDAADYLEISIYSQWVNSRLIYNIEVTQDYSLVLSSSGLCVTRLHQCEIESVPKRKRSTTETTATEVCDVFVEEAKKTAKQLVGNTISPMIAHAREACITDILLTNNIVWGESAVWFILVDSIRQAPLSRAQRKEKMMDISSSIAEAVERAKPKAESIMGISTTIVSSITTESPMNTSTTIFSSNTTKSMMKDSTKTSSSSTNVFEHSLILLCLVLSIVCGTFY